MHDYRYRFFFLNRQKREIFFCSPHNRHTTSSTTQHSTIQTHHSTNTSTCPSPVQVQAHFIPSGARLAQECLDKFFLPDASDSVHNDCANVHALWPPVYDTSVNTAMSVWIDQMTICSMSVFRFRNDSPVIPRPLRNSVTGRLRTLPIELINDQRDMSVAGYKNAQIPSLERKQWKKDSPHR